MVEREAAPRAAFPDLRSGVEQGSEAVGDRRHFVGEQAGEHQFPAVAADVAAEGGGALGVHRRDDVGDDDVLGFRLGWKGSREMEAFSDATATGIIPQRTMHVRVDRHRYDPRCRVGRGGGGFVYGRSVRHGSWDRDCAADEMGQFTTPGR